MPVKDFTLGIKNLKGEDAKTGDKPFAMKDMLVMVLLEEGDQGQFRIKSGVERAKAAALAVKVYSAEGAEDYTTDELKVIKDRVELIAPPLATLRIVEYLDAKELKKE